MKYLILATVLSFSQYSFCTSTSNDPKYVSLIPSELGAGPEAIKVNISVYSEANLKSNSNGTIKSAYNSENAEKVEIYFQNSKEERLAFKPNLVSGFCEASYQKNLFLQICKSYTDKWCNLGKGPWGEKGWVNLEPQDIFKSDLRFTFDNFAGASISKDEKGIYRAIGFDRTTNKNKDGVVKRDMLITKEGKLKASVDCKPYSC